MNRIVGVIVGMLLVGGALVSFHLHGRTQQAHVEKPAPRAILLDQWFEAANVQYRRPWPTGFDSILITRIPSSMGHTFFIGVSPNGVSPCTGSGVCRQ